MYLKSKLLQCLEEKGIVHLVFDYCGPKSANPETLNRWNDSSFRGDKSNIDPTTWVVTKPQNAKAAKPRVRPKRVNEYVTRHWPECVLDVYYFGTLLRTNRHGIYEGYHKCMVLRCTTGQDPRSPSGYFVYWATEGPAPLEGIFDSFSDLLSMLADLVPHVHRHVQSLVDPF
jgi:hypothetical protein